MRRTQFAQAVCCSLLLIAGAARMVVAQDSSETSKSISWTTAYQSATEQSSKEGKPVLVRITATWCGPCQQMKQLTYTDARVVSLVNANFVPLMIDADQQPELVSSFKVEAYPTTIVMAPDLSISKRLTGYQSADMLVSELLPLAKSRTFDDSNDGAISALEPENGLKFGFGGFCLVSLLEETKVRKGSPDFTAIHRDQTICFQSDEQRQKFLQDPEKYWPVANGQCLVSTREGEFSRKGDPRMAVTWRGKIWLFTNRERQKRFIQSPTYYANEL